MNKKIIAQEFHRITATEIVNQNDIVSKLLKESDRLRNEMDDLRAKIQGLEDERDHLLEQVKEIIRIVES